jgi:hypothetical protein
MDKEIKVKQDCHCKICGKDFTFMGMSPEEICDDCGKILRDFIFGRRDDLPDDISKLLPECDKVEVGEQEKGLT